VSGEHGADTNRDDGVFERKEDRNRGSHLCAVLTTESVPERRARST
jgi:hypothetical protein